MSVSRGYVEKMSKILDPLNRFQERLAFHTKLLAHFEHHVQKAEAENIHVGFGYCSAFVQGEDNILYPLYYQRRTRLIGVPIRDLALYKAYGLCLKLGHSFEELGIKPRGFWRKDVYGAMTQIAI